MTLEAGNPWPLGATLTKAGVNFAVFSAHATRIELCLYDRDGVRELARVALPAYSDGVWHGLLPGAGAGLVYGLRAHGPQDAARGHRFNPDKLLLDPYARRLTRQWRWSEAHLGDVHDSGDRHVALDNARDMPKAVVEHEGFDWGDDSPPRIPLADTVLYEVHVKGFTWRHPEVPAEQRGRFLGVSSAPAIEHLRRLGVTSVNLLPVQQHLTEPGLARRGAHNYWGYNTLAFNVPDARFAAHDAVHEFRSMVRQLHAAGLEVILDVVYNHSAESDQRGPTVSWRGLDNASWYRLRHEDARFYENHAGTGNSLDLNQPRVLQFVLDSLRYWVTDMHVDGFRFDLAASLARGPQGFDARHPFLMALAQDPVLSRVKLIAEPWDAGPGGYQLGHFPPGWSEWNDKYRDAVRAFWVRKTADRGEFAARLAGSSELFRHGGRGVFAGINFITAHDGFTLHDLVSYDRKHNESNGEDNRDGPSHNLSWNCGAEGDTDLLMVNTLRGRLKRALLATLMLSRGVPMLLGGDELGRSQRGNNNAYAHDDEVSWYDWSKVDAGLLDFTTRLIAMRRTTPQLRDARWWNGETDGSGHRDVQWLDREGNEMHTEHWQDGQRFVLGMLLGARAIEGTAPLLVLFNAEQKDCPVTLPAGRWTLRFDTALPAPFAQDGQLIEGPTLSVKARSVTVLQGAMEMAS